MLRQDLQALWHVNMEVGVHADTLTIGALSLQANPLDPDCEKEGKVVCHQGHIKGQPGLHMHHCQQRTLHCARSCECMYPAAELG